MQNPSLKVQGFRIGHIIKYCKGKCSIFDFYQKLLFSYQVHFLSKATLQNSLCNLGVIYDAHLRFGPHGCAVSLTNQVNLCNNTQILLKFSSMLLAIPNVIFSMHYFSWTLYEHYMIKITAGHALTCTNLSVCLLI